MWQWVSGKCCSARCLGRCDFPVTLLVRVEYITSSEFQILSIEMQLAKVKVWNCSPFSCNLRYRLWSSTFTGSTESTNASQNPGRVSTSWQISSMRLHVYFWPLPVQIFHPCLFTKGPPIGKPGLGYGYKGKKRLEKAEKFADGKAEKWTEKNVLSQLLSTEAYTLCPIQLMEAQLCQAWGWVTRSQGDQEWVVVP